MQLILGISNAHLENISNGLFFQSSHLCKNIQIRLFENNERVEFIAINSENFMEKTSFISSKTSFISGLRKFGGVQILSKP